MALRVPWKRDFESAVKPELPVMYRVARRLASCQEDAEELVHTSLIRAFQAWDNFDGRYLRSWLVKILRNEHYARFRDRADCIQLPDEDHELPADDGLWDQLLTRDQVARIREEMERLPVEYKMAVHLCDAEEMSYEEAAQAMDVPVGTVRSRLFRGRAMLRQRLIEDIPEQRREVQ